MKTLQLAGSLSLLFTLFVTGLASAAGQSESSTSYKVTIPGDNHEIALVTASLIPVDKTFYMFRGANQLPRRWSTFVSNVQIVDEDNQPVPFTAMDDGSWLLSAVPQGRVTLSYQLDLDHEEHSWSGGVDGAAYARDWGVFYAARSLFIVNGEDRENIHVHFDLPEHWQVTTPWQKRSTETQAYSVADYDNLSTSILFAGTHKQLSIRQGQFELLLALGGEEILAQEDVFVDMARGVLEYYTDLMGGIPNLPTEGGVIKSMVVINPSATTDGEALGKNISLLLDTDGDQMSQVIGRFIFAHEFFHLWNGKSFTPESDETEWFKEGFSNYYTIKALHHIGYLDDASYLDMLANFFYQRYDSDDGVGSLSMTDGELKHDHWGLIYSGGLFVAIAQDMQIRTASNNEKSVDDMMRFMFDKFSDETYDIDDVEQALSHLNNESQKDFFTRYIVGTERLPVAQSLELANIETLQENGQTAFRIREEADGGKSKVRSGLFDQ